MIVAGRDQIQGWKEIAAFLGRDERTAKRWEKQRGLPVRRIPGAGRANVYVLVSELEAWLALTETPAETSNESDSREAELPDSAYPVPAEAEPETSATHSPSHAQSSRPNHDAWIVVLVIATLFTGAIFAAGRVASRNPPPDPTSAAVVTLAASADQPSPAVDQLYLQGIFFFEERTPASLEHARKLFEQAIARDPHSARSFAGLAETLLLLREYGVMPPVEAYTRARDAADRAVALDPRLSDPHAALGFIDFFFSWNPTAAREQFRTAIELNPNSALAHLWYGSMLLHQALYAEAIEQLDIAERLQPSSSAILAMRALALGLGGHRAEAVDILQSLVVAHRDATPPHHILATLSLVEPHDVPRYLEETKYFSELRHDEETVAALSIAGTALHRSGEPAFWAALLEQERHLHPSPEAPTFHMAEAEAALGRNDQALADLSRLVRQHDPDVIGISIDPLFAPLRENPRFQQLVAEVGLPAHPNRTLGPSSTS